MTCMQSIWVLRAVFFGAVTFGSWVPQSCTLNSAQREPVGLRQPGEFEPQAAVWLSADPDDPASMIITARLIAALTVPIKLIARDEDSISRIREQLSASGVGTDRLTFLVDPLSTFFMRDAAVFLVDDQGGMQVLDLKWSLYGLPGWCRRMYPNDPKLQAQCEASLDPAQDGSEASIARMLGAGVVSSPLCLENAAFEVNGRGVVVLSETLAQERNPGLGRAEMERLLLEIPGTKKVIWLSDGLAQDPLERSTITGSFAAMGAGGHTDEFVRFADASTVLLAWVDDDEVDAHPLNRINRERMERNFEILSRSTDQDGRPFRIVKIPLPRVISREMVLAPRTDSSSAWNELDFQRSEGRKAGDVIQQVASASYLNLLIANDVVIVPSYVEDGTPADAQERVRRSLEDVFPGRTIRFLNSTVWNWNGGGPHCATLSEPRAR
jgi:agmatine deiminase